MLKLFINKSFKPYLTIASLWLIKFYTKVPMFSSLKYFLLSYGSRKYISCRYLLILILTSGLTPEKTDKNENAL
jgi:hypothetical protein